jgi:hypothetical protein
MNHLQDIMKNNALYNKIVRTCYEMYENNIKKHNSFFHSSWLSLSHRYKKRGEKGGGDQDIKYF